MPDTLFPSVGRIVHYHPSRAQMDRDRWRGGGPFAAIITDVQSPSMVSLTIFLPGEKPVPLVRIAHIERAPEGGPYWNWPPRN